MKKFLNNNRRIARALDELTRLNEESFANVAEQMFEDAKQQIMTKVEHLDIYNITEVEDLYIMVAQLTNSVGHLGSYVRKSEI